MSVGESWPTSHKASYILGLLCRELGYTKSPTNRGDNGVLLVAAGRSDIRWTYTNKQTIAPSDLRRILLDQAGLDEEEARALVAERQPGQYVPRTPPDFLDTLQPVPGRVPKRWQSRDGTLYEYDQRHGHVEGYNKRGKHIGVFDVVTGERIGEPVRGRKIDV